MARCLVLARAMQSRMPRARIDFLLDGERGDWSHRLPEQGFHIAEHTAVAEAGYGLVFDHPDTAEAVAVVARASAVMVVDDDGRGLQGSDLVLHPHPDLENAAFGDCPALCGAEYALIDPEWSDLGGRSVDEPVSSVLIAFGMVDSVNAAGAVLAALLALPQRPQRIVVAVGADAPHRPTIEVLAGTYEGCSVVAGCSDLKPLVEQAHIVVGAGGVSLMERLAAGRVNMVVAQNDVQARLISAVADHGAAIAVGKMPAFDKSTFIERYQQLCASAELRRQLAEDARKLVDGKGAARVASRLADMPVRSRIQH